MRIKLHQNTKSVYNDHLIQNLSITFCIHSMKSYSFNLIAGQDYIVVNCTTDFVQHTVYRLSSWLKHSEFSNKNTLTMGMLWKLTFDIIMLKNTEPNILGVHCLSALLNSTSTKMLIMTCMEVDIRHQMRPM